MHRQLMILATLITLAADQVGAYDLSQHQWRHRLMFLITPASDDPDLAAQQREIALRRDAVLDRDLRVFLLLGETGFIDDAALPPRTVESLREQLGVTPEDRLLTWSARTAG